MSDIFKAAETPLYWGIYRGTVVDNDDPEKLGRIKVRIYPMYIDLAAADIPFATPANSLFSGAGNGFGSFVVPDVGSNVFCFFEAGRVDQPVFFAEATDAKKGIPSESSSNYPNRKVWKTSQGFTVYFDGSNNEFHITHPNNVSIVIDNTGKVSITGAKIVLNSSDVALGDEAGDRLVKMSDIGLQASGNLLTADGKTCGFNPAIYTNLGTKKVKGS